MFKIDNLAKFYLDTVIGKPCANGYGNGCLYFRPDVLRNGIVGIGASTVGIIEESSGIGYDPDKRQDGAASGPAVTGFWDDSTTKSFRPKPTWLNRLVFFDQTNDSPNSGDPNYTTNHFLTDLQGQPDRHRQVSPERVIPDP